VYYYLENHQLWNLHVCLHSIVYLNLKVELNCLFTELIYFTLVFVNFTLIIINIVIHIIIIIIIIIIIKI